MEAGNLRRAIFLFPNLASASGSSLFDSPVSLMSCASKYAPHSEHGRPWGDFGKKSIVGLEMPAASDRRGNGSMESEKKKSNAEDVWEKTQVRKLGEIAVELKRANMFTSGTDWCGKRCV